MPKPNVNTTRPDHVRKPIIIRPNTTNATLLDLSKHTTGNRHEEFKLWVYDLVVDFALSGSTAQGPLHRDFYPRNFAQPNFTIVGQSPNEEHHLKLGEFIRNAQRAAARGQGLMKFSLPGAGFHNVTQTVTKRRGTAKRKRKVRTLRQRTMKGYRRGILLQGYVQNFQTGAERWVVSPEYSFQFTVARALAGPFQDDPVTVNFLAGNKRWDQLLREQNYEFVEDPDVAFGEGKGYPPPNWDYTVDDE